MPLPLTIGSGRALLNGAAAFSPLAVAGLRVWSEARLIASSDGTAIASATDFSGNSAHATQATGTKQPLWKAAIIGGQPVFRFDLTDDFLTTPSIDLTGTNGVTMFAITANIGSATDRIIFETSNNFNLNPGAFICFRDTGNKINQNLIGNVGSSPTIGTTNITSAATIIECVYDMSQAANAETQLYINGTAEGSHTGGVNNTGNFGNFALNLGARNGGTVPLGGDLGGWLMYTRALSAAERQYVRRGLAAIYGITVA